MDKKTGGDLLAAGGIATVLPTVMRMSEKSEYSRGDCIEIERVEDRFVEAGQVYCLCVCCSQLSTWEDKGYKWSDKGENSSASCR